MLPRINWFREIASMIWARVKGKLAVALFLLIVGFMYSTWQECLHCADGCRDYGIAPEMTACGWPQRCMWHIHGDRWPAHAAWWPKNVFVDIVGQAP